MAVLFRKTGRESFRRDKCQHVIGLVVETSSRESHGNVWAERSAPRPCSGVVGACNGLSETEGGGKGKVW